LFFGWFCLATLPLRNQRLRGADFFGQLDLRQTDLYSGFFNLPGIHRTARKRSSENSARQNLQLTADTICLIRSRLNAVAWCDNLYCQPFRRTRAKSCSNFGRGPIRKRTHGSLNSPACSCVSITLPASS